MNYITITEILRKQIIDKYYYLKEMFFDNNGEDFEEDIYDINNFEDINNDFSDDEFEENIDDFIEEEGNNFENEVYDNLIVDIRNSKYKNIIYLIILKDNFEYLKSNKIKYKCIGFYEDKLLTNLESIKTDKLIKLLDIDDEVFLDALTIFLEYNILCNINEKHEIKKLLKYKNVSLKKFKIDLLDDIEYQFSKKRNK